MFFASILSAETLPTKTFKWYKVEALGHSYIVFYEDVTSNNLQVKHDPSCQCRKFTEEQIAKVIAEVLRLQRNQKA
jgi:hypothetical protein